MRVAHRENRRRVRKIGAQLLNSLRPAEECRAQEYEGVLLHALVLMLEVLADDIALSVKPRFVSRVVIDERTRHALPNAIDRLNVRPMTKSCHDRSF